MDKTTPVMETPLHPSAQDQILEITTEDTERLIILSKVIASKSNSPAVLSNHVKDAYSTLSEHANKSKARDSVLILGSTFLGAFLPEFIKAVQDTNIASIVIWVVIGIVGIILTMFGLWGMK